MGASIYDTLFGFFQSGTSVNDTDEKMQTIISVMDNIGRILNSRAGAVKHLPDYGLPDMSMIYQALPTSAYGLMRAMQVTLLKYEPRLSAVEIELLDDDDKMVLSYELTCHFKEGGLVKYGTYFTPDGKAQMEYTHRKRRQS
ncbi:type VI secretion system baseplate subunit TssE [Frischella sp. Ac48]|uniref:Type VI secretion system baseplate subunit TssE n=1 Tax=Frischella japonica TaxID=2741544 RepID=A0ABR7QZ79_9GAMM|nr:MULTISPECIES: type VI secretion system baseplate subunit TssE [Frischella]MBC9131500.1 type VI secretion system baseplate subunit TssE [Frischella japonica]MBX4133954.1 type VI secretion system baseplate subunit TssE [Frischella sp. Ac48]